MAIYLNPGPQFQHMGTSPNRRLCIYLAMGVPVVGQPAGDLSLPGDLAGAIGKLAG